MPYSSYLSPFLLNRSLLLLLLGWIAHCSANVEFDNVDEQEPAPKVFVTFPRNHSCEGSNMRFSIETEHFFDPQLAGSVTLLLDGNVVGSSTERVSDFSFSMIRLDSGRKTVTAFLKDENGQIVPASSAAATVYYYTVRRSWDPVLDAEPPYGCGPASAAAVTLLLNEDWAPVPDWFKESRTKSRSIEILSPLPHQVIRHAFQADVIADVQGFDVPGDGEVVLLIDGKISARSAIWPCRFLLPLLSARRNVELKVAVMDMDTNDVVHVSQPLPITMSPSPSHDLHHPHHPIAKESVLFLCFWKGCLQEFGVDSSFYGELLTMTGIPYTVLDLPNMDLSCTDQFRPEQTIVAVIQETVEGKRDPAIAARTLRHLRQHTTRLGLMHVGDSWLDGGTSIYNLAEFVIRTQYSNLLVNDDSKYLQIPLGVGLNFWSPLSRPQIIQNFTEHFQVATAREYVWCFLGDVSSAKQSRLEMIKYAQQVPNGYSLKTSGFGRGLNKPEYRHVLQSSAFVLAPKGLPRHPESFRVWEALEMGSIPILEQDDDYWYGLLQKDHPLPMLSSWELLPEFIAKADADALQIATMSWWKSFKLKLSIQLRKILLNDHNYDIGAVQISQ